jgi:hypothetical protein
VAVSLWTAARLLPLFLSSFHPDKAGFRENQSGSKRAAAHIKTDLSKLGNVLAKIALTHPRPS